LELGFSLVLGAWNLELLAKASVSPDVVFGASRLFLSAGHIIPSVFRFAVL
jgi:hypothetical protein